MEPPESLADQLVLRAPREDDVAALTAMTNMPGVRRGTLRLPFTPEDFWRERVKGGPTAHAIVAEVHGQPVGQLTLMRRIGRQAHVGDIFLSVHDDFAGRGIGSALMAGALDLADNWLGLRRVQLEVYADNATAIRLYERCGFEREGLMRGESLRDGVLENVLMMARLRDAPPMAGSRE